MASERKPVDGTAVVLHLIEAAREWARAQSVPSATALIAWVTELEDRFEREKAGPEPVGWEPRRWRELVAGDQVEMGGVVAVIEKAYTGDWHVDPENYSYHPGPDRGEESDGCRACRGRCRETRGRKYERLEHSYAQIKLAGRDVAYKMPPDGEVECLRGPAGQALDEVNGRRSVFGEEPVNVMASWAADAALTLEAVGLGPVEVTRAYVDDTCHCSRSERMYCHSSKCHGGADVTEARES